MVHSGLLVVEQVEATLQAWWSSASHLLGHVCHFQDMPSSSPWHARTGSPAMPHSLDLLTMLLHLGIVAHPGKFVWTIDRSELSVHTRMAPGDLGSYKLANMNLVNL